MFDKGTKNTCKLLPVPFDMSEINRNKKKLNPLLLLLGHKMAIQLQNGNIVPQWQHGSQKT